MDALKVNAHPNAMIIVMVPKKSSHSQNETDKNDPRNASKLAPPWNIT